MKTYAVVNQKGGAGKSAVAVGLAGALVDQGFKVLVIDLEPQATVTEHLGARPVASGEVLPPDDYGPPLLTALLEGLPLTPYEMPCGIDLVPSGNAFNDFNERAFQLPTGQRELLLRHSLQALYEIVGPVWDTVLIDCPPSLDLITTNALAAADDTLFPVKLESASRTPFARLWTAAGEVKDAFNPDLDCIGIVGTFAQKGRRHSADMSQWLRNWFVEDLRWLVFDTSIRASDHVAQSHGQRLPVTHLARRDNIRRCIGADDFTAFAAEFAERAELGQATATQISPEISEEERVAAHV